MRIEESAVTFTIQSEPEFISVRGSFATGDEEQDRALEDEILARLAQDDTWAWCNVTVIATWEDTDGTLYEGRDQLGACSYANEKDFKADGYFADMKARALEELNAQIPANEIEKAVKALSPSAAKDLLTHIASSLSGQEWNADTCDDVARILRDAGIPIADLGEEAAT